MKKRLKIGFWLVMGASVFWGSAILGKDTREPYQIILDGITSCAQVLVPTLDSGRKGQADYFIVIAAIIIVVYTLFYSIKHLVRPHEKEVKHIKNQILEDHEH